MTSRALVLGGVTVAAAIAYSIARRGKGPGEAAPGAEAVEEVEFIPEIPPSKIVSIFNKLCALMNANITSVMRKVNASGGQVPQAMLQEFLVTHFETNLREIQAIVFKEFDVSEEELEEAVDYYEGQGGPVRDASVVDAINQLRQLYVNVGGSLDLELPNNLTVEKMCQVFEEYMSAVMDAQTAFQQHIQNKKAKGTQVTAAELTEARQQMMQEKISVVLKRHGLNSLLFQAAIEKFNEHPVFQAKIAAVKASESATRR